MSDPTEMVLLGSFGSALVLFGMGATARWVRIRRTVVRYPEPPPIDPASFECVSEAAPQEVALPPELPVGNVPVGFYQPFDLLGAVFIFAVFWVLALGSVQAAHDELTALKPVTLLVNIGFQCFLAGLVTILALRRIGFAAWLGLRWSAWPWVFAIAPCAVVSMWVVFGALQCIGYMDWMESLGVETVQDSVKFLKTSDDPQVLALMIVTAIVVAPICEEIVFRGYFYPVMKKFAGAWIAAACSALVFASAHGNLTATLPLFIFGGVLVFLYEKTGSIWAPIAAHCCFNSATVIVQFIGRYYGLSLDSAP